MSSKVSFYQSFGGRKAFIALLFFFVTLALFLVQGILDFTISFAQVASFWKWDAGIFVSGNIGSKCAKALREWANNKSNGKNNS
jgi:hypothetical protein